MFFQNSRKRRGDPVLIRVCSVFIRTSDHIKYFGVILDHRLKFLPHFSYVRSKVAKLSRALCRII